MNELELINQLRRLNENIVDLIATMQELVKIESQKRGRKKSSNQEGPMSPHERDIRKDRFEKLFLDWSNGNEFDVKRSLEEMGQSDLRRLADAANVSQDKKASKEKLLRLIITRFREKKMLSEGFNQSNVV